MSVLRWRFPDVSEDDARAQVGARIDAWWKAFAKSAGDFDAVFKGKKDFDLPGFMEEHYDPIAEGLFWEFGPGVTQQHRLVLTPESNRHLRPLADELLRRAPKGTGFDFFGYRLAEGPEQVQATVEGRTEVDVAKLTATVEPDEHGLVAITVFVPRDDDAHQEAAFVACEATLGEEALARWVGPINVETKGKGAPMAKLKPAFDALVQKRLLSLPDTPVYQHVSKAKWSLLEVKTPPEVEELAQRDLYLGKCIDVDFFNNTRSGRPFDSRRFSRHGETFAYLKIDGSQGLPAGGFEDKSSIEDAIDAALIPKKLGCHIGGGTGRRYSYVDLALTDVDQAVPVLRDVLGKGKLPKRSWIQFFDSDLQWEWIGIEPGAPAPPLRPIED